MTKSNLSNADRVRTASHPKRLALGATQEERRLSQALVRHVAEAAIRDRIIDPRGKTRAAFQREFVAHLERMLAAPDLRFEATIDYRDDLLRQARRFANGGDENLALLLYATWFEHWANHMLHWKLSAQKHFMTREVREILRTVQLGGKLSWLAKLVGLRPVSVEHQKTIAAISERRNAFVHYKWTGKGLDSAEMKHASVKLLALLRSAENTVRYLRRLENRQVYYGKRRLSIPPNPAGNSPSGKGSLAEI